jgi:hypothetical protein
MKEKKYFFTGVAAAYYYIQGPSKDKRLTATWSRFMKLSRGVLVVVPCAVVVGVWIGYQVHQDKIERQAFEDAMFSQLVDEEKERERLRNQREKLEQNKPKSRGFWG